MTRTVSLWRAMAVAGTVLLAGRDAAAQAVAPDAMRADTAGARRGDVALRLRNRTFAIPERVVSGLTIQPTIDVIWMATNSLRLSGSAQTVDNGGPGRQGSYQVVRGVIGGGGGNFLQELALEAQWRAPLGPNAGPALLLTGALSRSVRAYSGFDSAAGTSFGGNRREIVPSASLGLELRRPRGEATLAVAGVRLPTDNALYFRALPGESRTFGTVVGPEGTARLQLSRPVSLFARGFLPTTGYNTIERASGRPARRVAYDAGVHVRLSPALDAELFGSNALGNTGALAYVPDHDYHSVGAGITVRPGGRYRLEFFDYADVEREGELDASLRVARTTLSATTLTRGRWSARAAVGGQGTLAGLEYSLVERFGLGAFLDYPRNAIDEGELGALARLGLFDERLGAPLSASVIAAASRTNNPMINLLTGRQDELQRLGLEKGWFRFGDENENEGRLYVLALALAVERHLTSAVVGRVAPIVAVAQRNGVQVAGGVAGLSTALTTSFTADVEVGVDLADKGNVLLVDGRDHAVPWTASLTWRSDAFSGNARGGAFALRAFVGNRVGDSPFHALRVRANNAVTAGGGIVLTLP